MSHVGHVVKAKLEGVEVDVAGREPIWTSNTFGKAIQSSDDPLPTPLALNWVTGPVL